jgi:hypothetical protein
MLYLLIWILCGLAAMAIYRQKRRSGLIALLGGLVLGPLGVILALLTPALPPPPRPRVCLSCHKISPYDSDICPFCVGGRTIPT